MATREESVCWQMTKKNSRSRLFFLRNDDGIESRNQIHVHVVNPLRVDNPLEVQAGRTISWKILQPTVWNHQNRRTSSRESCPSSTTSATPVVKTEAQLFAEMADNYYLSFSSLAAIGSSSGFNKPAAFSWSGTGLPVFGVSVAII